MTAVNMVRRYGDQSWPPNAAITGGQLCIVTSVSGVDTVEVAGANALNVMGVALIDATTDALIASANAAGPIVGWPEADRVTLGCHGIFPVTYAANATAGVLLVAAANGQVTPYTPGTSTFDQIVGRCYATTVSGAVGPAYIGAI
jgi:hypothetical protein